MAYPRDLSSEFCHNINFRRRNYEKSLLIGETEKMTFPRDLNSEQNHYINFRRRNYEKSLFDGKTFQISQVASAKFLNALISLGYVFR